MFATAYCTCNVRCMSPVITSEENDKISRFYTTTDVILNDSRHLVYVIIIAEMFGGGTD